MPLLIICDDKIYKDRFSGIFYIIQLKISMYTS